MEPSPGVSGFAPGAAREPHGADIRTGPAPGRAGREPSGVAGQGRAAAARQVPLRPLSIACLQRGRGFAARKIAFSRATVGRKGLCRGIRPAAECLPSGAAAHPRGGVSRRFSWPTAGGCRIWSSQTRNGCTPTAGWPGAEIARISRSASIMSNRGAEGKRFFAKKSAFLQVVRRVGGKPPAGERGPGRATAPTPKFPLLCQTSR